jgi:hypothetical protein
LRRALRHECTVGGDQDEANDTTVNQIPEVLKKGRKEEGKEEEGKEEGKED